MTYGVAALVALGALSTLAAEGDRDLAELSLEELTELEVTSVSRRQEPRNQAAAAVAVISNEELRRSGVTSIPEALRMVPGLHVGRVTANSWAIGARGFSSVNSAKLLVLSDTRSLYTPLFSGVAWDTQDFLLEDVERVEVIRGPGATLWGSNAVNGVINITTKNARDTQGAYLEAGGGTEERFFGGARYGGQVGDRFHYRVFGKYVDRDGGFTPNGPGADSWWLAHVGLRADWEGSDDDTLTLQGDAYRANVGEVKPSVTIIGREGPSGKLVTGVAGGNVLARWQRQLGPGSDLQLRAYYDRTHRNDPSYLDDLDTFDIDFQHRFPLPLNQDVIWGVAYRVTWNRNLGKVIFGLEPPDSRDQVFSGFAQDTITFLPGLRLTLGTKLEQNDYSGFEVQPSVRGAWDPASGHTLWAAVSRAVRVPTRLERDVSIFIAELAPNVEGRLLGNRNFLSEDLLAYELGYRWQATPSLLIDAAGFYNRYGGLASLELGDPFLEEATGKTVVPVLNKNLTDGTARGGEVAVTYSPLRVWRLSASYSYLLLTLEPRGEDLNRGSWFAGATPRHQFALYSFLDLPAHFRLDGAFRWVSELRSSPEALNGEAMPAYANLDLRLSWQGWQPLEISVVGQNLLQAHHFEFPGGTEVQRAVYAKVAARF